MELGFIQCYDKLLFVLTFSKTKKKNKDAYKQFSWWPGLRKYKPHKRVENLEWKRSCQCFSQLVRVAVLVDSLKLSIIFAQPGACNNQVACDFKQTVNQDTKSIEIYIPIASSQSKKGTYKILALLKTTQVIADVRKFFVAISNKSMSNFAQSDLLVRRTCVPLLKTLTVPLCTKL